MLPFLDYTFLISIGCVAADSAPPSQVASAFVFVNVTEDKKFYIGRIMGFSSRLSKTHQTTRAAADDTISSTTTPGRTILGWLKNWNLILVFFL